MVMLGEVFQSPASSWFDADLQTSTVSVYLDQPQAQLRPLLPLLRSRLDTLSDHGLNTGPAEVALRPIRREDWAESWKRHFKPFVIGRRLLVVPSWSRRKPGPTQVKVVLDPGLSFGTGQHPTTRFCLEELVRAIRPGARSSMLDLGTGTGILAIAAVRLGFAPVEALDFDPQCIRTSTENARRNRVAGRVDLRRADVTRLPLKPRKRFDVVTANLLDNLLIQERDRILAQVAPGGRVILAGILTHLFPAVEQAFHQAGWELLQARTEGEWRSGSFARVP